MRRDKSIPDKWWWFMVGGCWLLVVDRVGKREEVLGFKAALSAKKNLG
jgi:hypothetical protein